MIKKVGILYHPMKRTAGTLAGKLEGWLHTRGVTTWQCSAWDDKKVRSLIDETELVLTIGGDGTILRAAQATVSGTAAITGINLGRLGFMTELGAKEAEKRLPELLSGEGWTDERAVLEIETPGHGEVFYALNDAVLARGAIARTITVETSVDGQPLIAYKADGVIVSTATGSTGYSLAAGGPILHPRSEDYILLPIMPHLSPAHPIVLPPAAVLTLRVVTNHEATLSVDGHINIPLSSDTVITIRLSKHKVRFLRTRPHTFYGSLEKKLKGKH